MPNNEEPQIERTVFFLTVFIAGLCSIIYELLISTTSSYFMGDSVKQFSLVIGVYMAAMGLGSYLSKFISDKLVDWFIKIEILLGFIGGISVPVLYFTFEHLTALEYQFVMLGLTLLIGMLTGFEIPILVRILKTHFPLKANLAYVLSLDYIGALLATLLFPFLLLPFVGTFRTSLIFGFINVALGFFIYRFFSTQLSLERKRQLELAAIICAIGFGLLGIFSGKLLSHWEDNFYRSKVIFTKQTPYQKLAITKNKEDVRLYINRIIQFSSIDEYRYHETLAQVPMNVAKAKKKVLILGGGEGLLAREVLKYPEVEQVTIVDLDPEVFRIAKENAHVRAVNENALEHPKVKLAAEDAMNFLRSTQEQYDLILSDLPDPSNESVARLYSTAFFRLAFNVLSENGVFATQASSPFHTKKAYWCIYETLKASEFNWVYPFHTYVPSFGDWGFVLAAKQAVEPASFQETIPAKYLDAQTVEKMFYFEKDLQNPGNIKINKLDRPLLLNYFLEGWETWSKEQKN